MVEETGCRRAVGDPIPLQPAGTPVMRCVLSLAMHPPVPRTRARAQRGRIRTAILGLLRWASLPARSAGPDRPNREGHPR